MRVGTNRYKFPGRPPWIISLNHEKLPFLAAMAFSAKSPLRRDDWARSDKRPYQLILMPGYVPPAKSEIHPGDHEFVWCDRPIKKPTIVWDAFSPVPLFEAAYVNFRKDLVGDYIKVWDNETKHWLTDKRSDALLKTRPARDFSWIETDSLSAFNLRRQKDYKALSKWSYDCMVESSKASGNTYDAKALEARAWSMMNNCYAASITDEMAAVFSGRTSLAERKLNETRGNFNFVSQTDYKSALGFTFLDLQHLQHGVTPLPDNMTVLPPDDKDRVSRPTRKKIIHTPEVSTRPSLLGRLFGRKP